MAEKPIDAFRVPIDEDSPFFGPYVLYCDKRDDFAKAQRELKEATEALKALVGPMLPQHRLANGTWWKLREDDEVDALIIEVYAEEPKRGKQKAELPFETLNLPKEKKVA
jgi:hypothetical protein